MNDQIKKDLNAIKREISTNSRQFVQNLIKSLKLKKSQPFSPYKVDLSLFYLKNVYEVIFPQKRQGASLISNRNKSDSTKDREETDKVTESVTFKKGVSIH